MLDSRFGLDRGFERYDDQLGIARSSGAPGAVAERRGDRTVDAALAWLETAPERFLLWLHLYDPHAPYDPPESHRSRLLGRPYDGESAYADAELGRLLGAVEAKQPSGTLVVVTSDHGESLGDHGLWTHGQSRHDPEIRIPLIVKQPRQRQGQRRHENAGSAVTSGVTLSSGVDMEALTTREVAKFSTTADPDDCRIDEKDCLEFHVTATNTVGTQPTDLSVHVEARGTGVTHAPLWSRSPARAIL